MSERTEKGQAILAAAVRVFATKGYHSTRVGDIAEEAGVAHGLLYHYFRSKEEVLETIFRDAWSRLVHETEKIEASGEPAREQLRAFAAFFLESWLRDPDLIRVLIREVARSPEVGRRVDEIGEVFAALRRIVERGQASGELREADARLVSWIFYGSLEEILTGWVLGQLPDGADDVARAVDTVFEVIGAGLAADATVGA